jgi:hypothetical protein
MPVFFPISSLKRKHAGRGTNITVNNWFMDPNPNPIQFQIRVPRTIVPVLLVIYPVSTSRSTQGLLPRIISARDS